MRRQQDPVDQLESSDSIEVNGVVGRIFEHMIAGGWDQCSLPLINDVVQVGWGFWPIGLDSFGSPELHREERFDLETA